MRGGCPLPPISRYRPVPLPAKKFRLRTSVLYVPPVVRVNRLFPAALWVRSTLPFVWPLRMSCLLVVMPLAQVQEPLGMMTVSPSAALFTAVWTAAGVQAVAVMTAPWTPCVGRSTPRRRLRSPTAHRCILSPLWMAERHTDHEERCHDGGR